MHRSVRVALSLCLLVFVWGWAQSPASGAGRATSALRAKAATVTQNLAKDLSSPRRLGRMAITNVVYAGTSYLVLHTGGSLGSAAFTSYVANSITDRVLDRHLPGSRAAGAGEPLPWRQAAFATRFGASISSVASPLVSRGLGPFATWMQRLPLPGLSGSTGRLLVAHSTSGLAGIMGYALGASAETLATRAVSTDLDPAGLRAGQ